MNNSGAFCRDECYSNPPQCLNGGECYVDYKYKDLKCRCKDTDEYVYSGDKCEIGTRKMQALSFSVKDYVIIACSTAGAVVFILIIASLIKCLIKINRKGEDANDLNDSISDLNAATDYIQMNASSNGRYTKENNAKMHASGMPELTRDHRVYKDPKTGEKALIYQPKNITKLLPNGGSDVEYMQSEQTSRRSFYDYIDTENPYKIKRPNLNESRNWPM
ncbi:hypothetical protein ACJMK2_014503 [Sinanodonta woodiana]|uniref:EGF-like domain-containing protein n=1 Tax=Sinanodonta woodiana TaxID=1069815 RepID=A0ABD3V0U7_SINWO